MDIHIESINYDNHPSLEEYYIYSLNKKFGQYTFIKKIELKAELEDNSHSISIRILPENGKVIYASDKQLESNKAYQNTIRKIKIMIEKYKQIHYRSSHKR